MFITITDLENSELPDGKTIIKAVPGLDICGHGVNINNKTNSNTLFMKKQEHADLIRYTYHQNNILLLFITKLNKEYNNYTGGDILDKSNSNIKQIKSIVYIIDVLKV